MKLCALFGLLAIACTAGAQEEARPPFGAPGIEPPPGEPTGDPATILRRARDGLVAASEFEPALLPAQELVTTLRSDSEAELGADLVQLARIQAELGEMDAAEVSYLEGIRLLARSAGEFSLILVDPYHALGRAYLRADRYEEALVALQQAQHISQRNLGLFNVEQARLLDDMTIAHLSSGNTIDAERLQVQRLENALRRFGADDERVVPYRLHLADYYERSRLRGRARDQYQQIVAARTEQLGATHPSLLAPLREVAQIDLIGHDRSEARDRLAAILADSSVIEPTEEALSLAVLGDWALVGGDLAGAHDYYGRAYAALAVHDERQAAEIFGQPVTLDFIAPLTSVDRGSRSRRPYTYGTIMLRFALPEDGRPRDVRAIAAEPAGLMETAFVRRLRETHFRPRIMDGHPVATPQVEVIHHFRYYVDP